MRDAIESMKPPRHFAFGTTLPRDMMRHRVVADTSQWMTCKHVPKGNSILHPKCMFYLKRSFIQAYIII